ncbi:helix-turn-helix transcriptional regulator [Candidatus Woesearchaeota archaeon]|nr:helix-turn-helix transcriptional regulator [Candidatus Woesearchaeota archaeon]
MSNEETKNIFAETLLQIQTIRGKSNEEIAEYIGLTKEQFESALRGERQLFFDELKQIECCLGIGLGTMIDAYQATKWHSMNNNGTNTSKKEQATTPDKEVYKDDEESEGKPKYHSTPWDIQLTTTEIPIPEFDPENKKSIRRALGIIIKNCRIERGLSRQDLEDLSEKGIHYKSLIWYERGKSFPRKITPEMFAKAFNASQELFTPLYEAMNALEEKIVIEKEREREERAKRNEVRAQRIVEIMASTKNVKDLSERITGINYDIYDTIAAVIQTGGYLELAGTELGISRMGVQKRLKAIFQQDPPLEYIVYESLPPLGKGKQTFENALMRKIHELIKTKYTQAITGKEKQELAERAGFKSWFSLRRAIEIRGITIGQIMQTPISQKPFKEYSCAWPREAPREEKYSQG